jgi:MFS transporter, SHS family, sialic acid transporter
MTGATESGRGKWLALTAALLGWMFDGLEMGLFPLVARPAITDLLGRADDTQISKWFAVATASFLVGAATGGVLFGWLGDRLGRVRAMTLSVLTYAIFSGLCGLATAPEQIAVLRFLSALGMGGEWSLGVALVMEIWPDKSRAFLAGLIGAAANLGYLLVAVLGMWLSTFIGEVRDLLLAVGLPSEWVSSLVAHSGWRIIMILGAFPALLTFLIRLFVPESKRWEREQVEGRTSHWAARDLAGVVIGAAGAIAIIFLWARDDIALPVQIVGSLVALTVATLGYLYPVFRYLERARAVEGANGERPVRRMLLGACLGGVALLGTWASLQWASVWADQLTGGRMPIAKAYTQFWSAFGAILGTIGGALICDWIGRRPAYVLLCVGALASSLFFFQMNDSFGPFFLFSVFLAGGLTAAFYGWLPLYLPELFRTSVRATGQGFSFNFGRILAAIGALQTGYLTKEVFKEDYATACSVMSLIYLVGIVIIWLAPETRGKPLPP